MLVVINEFHVQAGQEEEFEDLFAQVQQLILQEPGCLSCRLHRERTDSNVYVSYLEWASLEALQAPHNPEIGHLIEQYPLEEPPRRRRFDVVGESPAS